MAIKEAYVAGIGPLQYDDSDAGAHGQGLSVDMNLDPTDDNSLVNVQGMREHFFSVKQASAGTLSDPSADLNSMRAERDGVLLLYVAASTTGIDEATLYRWDNNNDSAVAEDVPKTVDGADSGGGQKGQWISVAGFGAPSAGSFSYPYGGRVTNINTTDYYQSTLPGGSPGILGWNDANATITQIDAIESRGFLYEADKDMKLTLFNGTIQISSGATDTLRFYLVKGTPVHDATVFNVTSMGNTADITPTSVAKLYKYSVVPSPDTLAAGERLHVYIRKTATTGTSTYFFGGTLQGEYI